MFFMCGLPHDFWPQASVLFAEHHNRAERKHGSSPFKLRYGQDSKIKLFPFGCIVTYLKDSGKDLYPPKFQPRGRPGLHMGYAQHKAIIVMDLERFIKDDLRVFVVTRDFRVPCEHRFPVKMLMEKIDPVPFWHFALPMNRTHADRGTCTT